MNVKKYRNIEIVLCILSDCEAIKQNNSKQISSKYENSWLLNNSLLNYEWVKEEIRDEKILEINENENTIQQPPWDTLKAVLRQVYTALSDYIKKKSERSQINGRLMELRN